VVAADEREQGQRALLNLGHTFGHAIETATGYTSWLHGEAVAVGMYMAARLSADLGWINEGDVATVEKLLEAGNLPARPPEEMDTDTFMRLMAVDKKVTNNQLRLVLLKGIGHAIVSKDFDSDKLLSMLNAIDKIPTSSLTETV
jgi:3-dehydroquinate synthase